MLNQFYLPLLCALACAQVKLPEPDVADMKGPVVSWIKGLHSALAEEMRKDEMDKASLARGFGRMGNLYHGLKRYGTAEQFYTQAASFEQENADWFYYLGLLARDRGQPEDAVGYFRQCLQVSPNDGRARVRLGFVLLLLARAEEARTSFASAAQVLPDEAMVAFGLGQAADALGDYRAAVDQYQRALELQPNADYLHYPLGMAWRRLGNREKALYYLGKRGETEIVFADSRIDRLSEMVTQATLEVVLAMAADGAVAMKELLAFINTNLGGRQGLEAYLDEAAGDYGARPDGAFAAARLHYCLGSLLLGRGEKTWANGHFLASLSLFPTAEALVAHGNHLALIGKMEEALSLFERALVIEPRNRDGLFAKANALIELDKPAQARPILVHLLAEEPESVTSRLLMVKALRMMADLPAERLILDELMKLMEPGETRNRYQMRLAEVLYQLGETEAARTKYAAVSQQSADFGARMKFAGSLAMEDRFDEALSAYDKLIIDFPDKVEIHQARYAALVFQGDLGKAQQSLERSLLQAKPGWPIAHLLARLLLISPGGEENAEEALKRAKEAFDAVHNLHHAETMAMALANSGRFIAAVDWQQRLIEDANGRFDEAVLSRLKANLVRYKAELSFRQEKDPKVFLLPN